MPHPTPSECPACGHDRPRRIRASGDRRATSAIDREQRWVCGLCRYEWTVGTAPLEPPPAA